MLSNQIILLPYGIGDVATTKLGLLPPACQPAPPFAVLKNKINTSNYFISFMLTHVEASIFSFRHLKLSTLSLMDTLGERSPEDGRVGRR